jgi:hypothetical protein
MEEISDVEEEDIRKEETLAEPIGEIEEILDVEEDTGKERVEEDIRKEELGLLVESIWEIEEIYLEEDTGRESERSMIEE